MGLLLAVFLLFLPKKKKKKTICNRHSIFKQIAFQVQGTQLHPETPLSFTPSWSSSPVKMSSIYRIKSLSLCQKYLIGPNFLTKTAESPSLTSGKAERAEGVVALLSQLCCSVHWLHPLLCPAPRVTFSSGLRHSHLGARMWTQHLNSHCGWWRPSYQNQPAQPGHPPSTGPGSVADAQDALDGSRTKRRQLDWALLLSVPGIFVSQVLCSGMLCSLLI